MNKRKPFPDMCTSYAPCDQCGLTIYKTDQNFKVRLLCKKCKRWVEATHFSFDIIALKQLNLTFEVNDLLYKYDRYLRYRKDIKSREQKQTPHPALENSSVQGENKSAN